MDTLKVKWSRKDNIKTEFREIDFHGKWKGDSRLCPVAGFGISGVQHSGSAVRELVH
jgi:hypothetical protein